MSDYVASHKPGSVYEFYDGAVPAGFSTKQRTPMKFTSKSCTIAIVMRNRFDEGMVPGDPDGPFIHRDWVFTRYDTLLSKANYTLLACRLLRGGEGTPGWIADGELLRKSQW